MGDDAAASGGLRFDRMPLQSPVTDVDDMDVLLEQNVAGEIAIPQPVANLLLVGRGVGKIVLDGGWRIVVRGNARDLAEVAVMDATNDFN